MSDPLKFGITAAGNRIHRVHESDSGYSACGHYLQLWLASPAQVAAPLCKLCFKPDGTAA